MIYSQYAVETPGPGYVHIPHHEDFPEEVIKQMCVEVKKVVANVLRWTNDGGARNEMLDLLVMGLALIIICKQRFNFHFIPTEDYLEESRSRSWALNAPTSDESKIGSIAEDW